VRNGADAFDSRQGFELRNQFLVERRDLCQLGVTVLLTNVATFGAPFGDGGPPDGTNARRFQMALRFRF